jgi:hypothetical protein
MSSLPTEGKDSAYKRRYHRTGNFCQTENFCQRTRRTHSTHQRDNAPTWLRIRIKRRNITRDHASRRQGVWRRHTPDPSRRSTQDCRATRRNARTNNLNRSLKLEARSSKPKLYTCMFITSRYAETKRLRT